VAGQDRVYRNKHTDYLNQLHCPASEVARLQGLGYTKREICKELHVSKQLLLRISRAMLDPSQRFRAKRSLNSEATHEGSSTVTLKQ
jgi:hypothetical protein